METEISIEYRDTVQFLGVEEAWEGEDLTGEIETTLNQMRETDDWERFGNLDLNR